MKTRNTGSSLASQLALLCLVFQEGSHRKVINSLIGPYIAYGERFYMCEPNGSLLPWTWYLRGSHFNPYKPKVLQLMTGNVTGVVPFDDRGWTKIVVDLRSNNQWKENAFVFNFNKRGPCSVCKEHVPSAFKQFLLKGEDEGACPRPPGVYEVNDTAVGWTFPSVPIIPYGTYRFRVTFGIAENLHGCWVADAKTVPKTN
ncbi:uncharacterized protein LOC113212972 [Frankliniella occidentalis]|uniref:Uncharacterized protein LOC113212972 n=1 Tax=Frankliniella occidentalis TaxID=133901 RepID=A0A6J1T7I3_FRAOC|nr:uncharacterized protein LOC113212972 [Frankliniella occidentalis]